MAEFDYSNTILIVKPVGPDAAASLRSEYNTNRLKSFHFEDGISSVVEYDRTRSRECTPYVSRPPELQLHIQFDPGPKDATKGFVFGTDEEKCDVQLLENLDPDPDNKHGISRQHFRIDFNWKSGFLRLNNMSSTNGTGMTAPSVNNGNQLLRYNDMHILHPLERTKVGVGTLDFEISFPARGEHQHRYDRNWETFRAKYGMGVPDMKSLKIQPTLKITPFVQRRVGRRNTYLLHDEIGKGEFGMVCKATDDRIGELYAAKQFTTTKPGWDVKAYMEIVISQDVTHEHIVSFVDSIDDGGGPVLVMEYMPLGNLTELQRISSEEVRTVLRQALQALAYLHDEKHITHRDIKPENILVRSRTPDLFIKICDFGLSTQSGSLKTHCGTVLYAAAEIFTGSYTNSVDIWAMGVLGYQFIQGLPAHSERLDPQMWTKEIRRAIDHTCWQSNEPAVLFLQSMLELNPLARPSAKTCLSHPWIQSALPFSIRKRLRSSESITSRMQPSKRGLKQLPVDKSLENDIRRFLAPETEGHDRGHRLTTSPERANHTPHVGYERNTAREPAGKGPPRVPITTGQTNRKRVLKPARPSSKQVLPANEDVPKVTEFDGRYVQMKVNGQQVLMRKEDCFLNATQLITLVEKDKNKRKTILERMKKHTNVDVKSTKGGSWVNPQHARILCKHLGLERQLQPLLEYAQRVQGDDVEMAVPIDQDYLSETGGHQFIAVLAHPQPVMVRMPGFKVNANQILKVAGQGPQMQQQFLPRLRRFHHGAVDCMKGTSKYRGTYVDFDVAIGLCQKYGLVELESEIQQIYSNRPTLFSNGLNVEEQPSEVAGQIGASLRPYPVLPQDWREGQQPEPISAPDNFDPEDYQVRGDHPISHTSVSEFNISPGQASAEQESEHSSVGLGAKKATLHQHTRDLLRETDPQSLPAKISYYKSQDYQPQHSRLSLLKPNLKPPSGTVSPYESFTNTY